MAEKILFIHGKNDVGEWATNSVSRLVAQHAKLLKESFSDVHIIAHNDSKVEGVVCKKVSSRSNWRMKFDHLMYKLFARQSDGSSIKVSDIRILLNSYDAQSWVIVVCRLQELRLLERVGNKIPILLWTHHFTLPSSFRNLLYDSSKIAGWIFPTKGLYRAFSDRLIEKGIWPNCHVIPLLKDIHFEAAPEFNLDEKPHDIRLLFMGGSDPKKGLSKMINALILLQPQYNVTLNVLGCSKAVVQHITPYVEVRMYEKQNRDQVKSFLLNSDIGVVPSTWFENSPTALIEMASYGLYVMASNTGGIPDIIHESGELIESFDFPIAWKEAFSSVFQNIDIIRSNRTIRAGQYATYFNKEEIKILWKNAADCTWFS